MPTAPIMGKDLIDHTPEGQRVAACLANGQNVECQSCGAIWMQTDICYSCLGTAVPISKDMVSIHAAAVTLSRTRLEDYQCVRAEAQQQANLSKKPVNLFEVEPGVFGFRFEEYGKGEGYITTLQPE